MAEDNGPGMTITMVVCCVVSLLFMALRFYCKTVMKTKLGLDDMVLSTAWILHLIFCVLSIYCTKLGLGKHFMTADFDMTGLPELLRLLPIGQFFAVLAVAVSKSSFILTLLRLVTAPWQKAALWFMLATINMSMLSIAIVQFFQCSVPPTPGCVAGDAVIGLGVFAAGYSAVMDLVLTLFPSLVIWNLQMKTSEKVGVIVSMSLGVVAGVVGIYKTSTIPYVSRAADFTHGTPIVLIWLVAEVTATIIACSIPFFRPLVRRAASQQAKNSYGLSAVSNRSQGWSRADKLNSRGEAKADHFPDDSSDRDILPAASKSIHRTDVVTVEYDSESANGDKRNHSRQGFGPKHRDLF